MAFEINYHQIMLEAVYKAASCQDPNDAINQALAYIGEHVGVERDYIFEFTGPRNLANTFEWCAPGIIPEIDNLKEVNLDVYLNQWIPNFKQNKPVVIKNLDDYAKTDPVIADILRPQNIQRLITVPLWSNSELIGFIGFDNPPADNQEKLTTVLQSIVNIFASLLHQRDINNQLTDSATYDEVSGVYRTFYLYNRMNKIWRKKSDKKRSVIYFNIEQFKIFNETFGMDKGNELLKDVAGMISKAFNTQNIARISADHFVVFYEGEDEEEKVKEVHDQLLNFYNSYHFRLWLEAGIYHFNSIISFAQACDYAKIACDQIQLQGLSVTNVYDDELKSKLELKKYIQDNVDEAIKNNYLQVYYQPVIRSISGHLCGFEALSRWFDPKYGVIGPDVFVPALEEKHLSYKLFEHVVDEVTDLQREIVNKKGSVVQISINLSKEDFDSINPLEYLENAVNKNNLKRWYFAIEITESVILKNRELINNYINAFRKAGYQVWMDDFGSGYSSLSVLKDFEFDEIKLDMQFMHNFDDRSKKIVKSVIDMAKDIGISTLAEGVETKEQVEFLKDAGCSKIQGFYFSKPAAIRECSIWMKREKIEIETEKEWDALQSIKTFKFYPDRAFGFVIDYGIKDGFLAVYASPLIKKQLSRDGFKTRVDIDQLMNGFNLPFARRFRKLAKLAVVSHKKERLEFIMNKYNYRLQMKQMGNFDGKPVFLVEVLDITNEEKIEDSLNNEILNNVLNVFDVVYEVDFSSGKFKVITSSNPEERTGEILDWKQIQSKVNYDDQVRLSNIMSKSDIKSAIEKTGRGYFNELLRIKQEDGSYQWTTLSMTMLPETNGNKYLVCFAPSTFAFVNNPSQLAKIVFEDTVKDDSTLSIDYDLPNDIITADQEPTVVQTSEYTNNYSETELNHETLMAIMNIFYSIGEVDLENDTILPFSIPEVELNLMGSDKQGFNFFINKWSKEYIADKYQKSLKDFANVRKLSARLTHIGIQSMTYVHKTLGWSKIYIIPALRDEDGRVIRAVYAVQNINEEMHAEALINYRAEHDALTGLLNRNAYMRVTKQLMDEEKDVTFIIMDVDHFKNVNDTYGHEKGDWILQTVANDLNEITDDNDYVIRMGGDEFVVIKQGSDENLEVIKNNIEELNRKFSKLEIKISVSAGIAVSKNGYSSELYQQADQALYYVKQNGRGGSAVYHKSKEYH